jgi:hypothetical protein
MGRPRLTKETAKSMLVRIRVTPAEREAIMRYWQLAGAKNESAWIRQRLLGKK